MIGLLKLLERRGVKQASAYGLSGVSGRVPSSTSNSVSSPSRTISGEGAARPRSRLSLGQLHVDRLPLSVADDLELDRVSRLEPGDDLRQVGLRHDLPPVDGHDDVAAHVVRNRLEVDLLVPRHDAGVLGRAAGLDPLDDRACLGVHVELFSELR